MSSAPGQRPIRPATPRERVVAAMTFQAPDRVPRYWSGFWAEFEHRWEQQYGPTDLGRHFGDDLKVVAADEAPWPSRARVLKTGGGEALVRTAWGELKRTALGKQGAQSIGQTVEAAIGERVDPDTITFDDPRSDSRYQHAGELAAAFKQQNLYVMAKTGGPYLRAAFLRGEENLWMDVAEDPAWVRALVDRIVDHMIVVGLESLRRFDLGDMGIGIFDDVSAGWGPFVGPDNYEKVFLPALRRMVRAYREAGAVRVMHHADGNVLPLLDMWIDAGIDAINPVEYRCGMDPIKIRAQYGERLVCIGGLDNCGILPRGDHDEINAHVRPLLAAGRAGGFIIGPHSIGPDIAPETMAFLLELLEDES